MSWKAWFILTWLTILTGKLAYLARKIVDAYCIETNCLDEEHAKYRTLAEAIVIAIMTVIFIAVGAWIILTFPE